jgi:WD40 repeat protein
MARKKKKSPQAPEAPAGLRLVRTLRGHGDPIASLAWAPDGTVLASGSTDYSICLWNTESGEQLQTMKGHTSPVVNLAWAPDGKTLASTSADKTVRLWDTRSGEQRRLFKGHGNEIFNATWSPDLRSAASAFRERTLRLWDTRSGKVRQELEGHSATILSATWSPDGRTLASGSADTTIRLWDSQNGGLIRTLELHGEPAVSLAWAPDSRILACGSGSSTINIWDTELGRELCVLEGHTSTIWGLSFDRTRRLLASQSFDGTVHIWRCDTWESVAVLKGFSISLKSIAFNPERELLALVDQDSKDIQLWALDYETLLGKPLEPTSRHYRNAKVVLVGDTGVGKSGLGMVLSGQRFQPTISTHGRRVWTLDNQEVDFPDGRQELRETLLWDLAGQPGYRLIHQLHLNEVSVALVIFDARSETEPFAGVRHWDRALRQAQRIQGNASGPLKKFLVAARCDRGGISVSPERLSATLRDLHFDGFFETSAKEGTQIAQLVESIHKAIPWDGLQSVSSNELFQTIKQFLIREKESGRLLSTVEELARSFSKNHPELEGDPDLRAKFDACIGRVENRGLIRRLRFGGYVLLQPELLDAYASSMINTAKSEPDGLGFIAEEDALAGRFSVPPEDRVADKDMEKLLLIATIEELLRHELALKETTDAGVDLVFPSQLTREAPDEPELPGKSVIFAFEGALLNIYSTLVVRLSHSQLFKKKDMWKNATAFEAAIGGTCGIHLRELREGQGELTLFFDGQASEVTRYQFEGYVAAHLDRRAVPGSLRRRRIFVCPDCNEPITDSQRLRRLERGFSFINCPVCQTQIELRDSEERPLKHSASAVREMDDSANAQRDRNTAEAILLGKREARDYDVFLCHNSEDKPAVKAIGERLKKLGILPWLDEWDLQPGLPWQQSLEEQIDQVKAVAVFVGAKGLGPWQDLEQNAFLRQFVKRRCPIIPVILETSVQAPKLPYFLEGMGWVDFRKSDPDPMAQLVWGITGKRAAL